jgi:RNA polymerase sigma-70 factor (ECF subfamily)
MIDHLFRSRAGQMVAYLTRLLGPKHLELAEDVVQEALVKALQRWPWAGVPANPSGWLFEVARNNALDVVRRNRLFAEKSAQLAAELAAPPGSREFEEALNGAQPRDDELRMIFLCCHPEVSRDARVALSLKTIGGFSVLEIARAFLVDPAAVAQRLVRAKRQIRELGIRFELPAESELAQRLDAVLEVVYLMFNEGYSAHGGADLIRHDLCGEALRLGRLLAASPFCTPRVHALVALMAFQAARLAARVDDSGDLVLMEDQDRSLWDRRLIALGFRHFAESAEGTEVSEYHVQAAICAAHAGAADPASTNWKVILNLYDDLMALNPSPVVALNRAVAVARVHGSAAALRFLDPLLDDPALGNYYLLPAVRGRLLMDVGDRAAAAECFRQALERPCSEPERRYLARKLAECSAAEA